MKNLIFLITFYSLNAFAIPDNFELEGIKCFTTYASFKEEKIFSAERPSMTRKCKKINKSSIACDLVTGKRSVAEMYQFQQEGDMLYMLADNDKVYVNLKTKLAISESTGLIDGHLRVNKVCNAKLR